MSTKASRGLRFSQNLDETDVFSVALGGRSLICPKCGKAANVLDLQVITTKSGSYKYWRFRHLDNRKRSGYATHYGPLEDESTA